MNSSSVKGGLINIPLFLLEGNAILPMTPKADCAMIVNAVDVVDLKDVSMSLRYCMLLNPKIKPY